LNGRTFDPHYSLKLELKFDPSSTFETGKDDKEYFLIIGKSKLD